MPLNPQQRTFCHEFMVDFVQTRAYIRAGYEEAGANQGAWNLMQNPDVKAYIDELTKERGNRLAMTADDVFNELVSIAKDDIGNYLEFDEREVVRDAFIGGESIETVENIVNIKIKDSTNISTKNIKSISRGKDGQFKIELYPRDNALEKLGKIHGIFEKDNLQKQPVNVTMDEATAKTITEKIMKSI